MRDSALVRERTDGGRHAGRGRSLRRRAGPASGKRRCLREAGTHTVAARACGDRGRAGAPDGMRQGRRIQRKGAERGRCRRRAGAERNRSHGCHQLPGSRRRRGRGCLSCRAHHRGRGQRRPLSIRRTQERGAGKRQTDPLRNCSRYSGRCVRSRTRRDPRSGDRLRRQSRPRPGQPAPECLHAIPPGRRGSRPGRAIRAPGNGSPGRGRDAAPGHGRAAFGDQRRRGAGPPDRDAVQGRR